MKTNPTEFKIEVPNGYEIDKANSTFERIVFKEIGRVKYPTRLTELEYGDTDTYTLTRRYGCELDLLDRLLLARDEWNEIDRFVTDWGNDDCTKYCVVRFENEIKTEYRSVSYSKFAFKSQETAQLFLDTFRTELEEIKELL